VRGRGDLFLSRCVFVACVLSWLAARGTCVSRCRFRPVCVCCVLCLCLWCVVHTLLRQEELYSSYSLYSLRALLQLQQCSTAGLAYTGTDSALTCCYCYCYCCCCAVWCVYLLLAGGWVCPCAVVCCLCLCLPSCGVPLRGVCVWGLCPLRSFDRAFSLRTRPHAASPPRAAARQTRARASISARGGAHRHRHHPHPSDPTPGRRPGHQHMCMYDYGGVCVYFVVCGLWLWCYIWVYAYIRRLFAFHN